MPSDYRLHKVVHMPSATAMILMGVALVGLYVCLFILGIKVWGIADAITEMRVAIQTLQP